MSNFFIFWYFYIVCVFCFDSSHWTNGYSLTLHFQRIKLLVWMQCCGTKTYRPRQCGQKAPHHFMCKWSSLITELSIRLWKKKKKKNSLQESAENRTTEVDVVSLHLLHSCICLRLCIFQRAHAFLAHKLSRCCEFPNNCCQSNPSSTQTNKHGASASSPALRTHNTPKNTQTHPQMRPSSETSVVSETKAATVWVVGCLSKLLNGLIVTSLSPGCRLNWPL